MLQEATFWGSVVVEEYNRKAKGMEGFVPDQGS
jgi:hypothetical protein